MMRLLLAAGILGLALSAHAGGSSALSALRAAKSAAGRGILIEMIGERGDPNPQRWKLIYSDPEARGGIKEVVVAGSSIEEIRTPLRGYTGVGAQPAIVPGRLNLDSGGAFDIANKQAIGRQLGFNWADYTLRTNNVTGAPMWVVRLYDHMGVPVGVTQVSAEDGSIIMPLEVASRGRTDEDTAESAAEQKIGGAIGTVGNVVGGVANKVKNTTLRAVGTVQEVFTGERTVGPSDEQE